MRSFASAIRNIRRSPYQAFTAILMMTLTFFVAYAFIAVLFGAELSLKYVETRPQVTAYFVLETPVERIEAAKQAMEQKPYVSSVNVVTNQEALQIFQEDNKQDPLLLELVTADILPASIEVSSTDIGSLAQISEDLKSLEGVEEVVFHKDVIDNLSRWTNIVRAAGVGMTSVHAVIGLLFIFVVVGFRIAMKRSEITVMQLLGASFWYIAGPFVMEGVLYGLIGAVGGWLVFYTILLYMTPALVSFFGSILPLPVPPMFVLSLLLSGVGIGVLIGMIASFFSVRRFLRA